MLSLSFKPFLSSSFHRTTPLHSKPHRLQTSAPTNSSSGDCDGGIPADDLKILAQFRSLHNYISVLEISRRADSPFAGSRLLLLDSPGNIHSISYLFKPFTSTYFDVFATFPPILPPGPIAILGFAAGTAARLILNLYPNSILHGWELDPSVIAVAREFFGLEKLEKQMKDNLFIYIGDALDAEISNGFAGIVVDLFSKGSLIPELQERETWVRLKGRLKRGGRVMVNCGGSCVESEDERRDGRVLMEETVRLITEVFGKEVFVLHFGGDQWNDSCVALTGPLPDAELWKGRMVKELRGYVDMWRAYRG